MEDVVILYRPTGPKELALLAASGWKRWPPRLPEQPILYPVTNEAYAREIAERWNAKESGAGFVTRFSVRKAFLDPYERHVVGAREHEEYWIPAEELEALNDAIVGEIEVVASFGAAGERDAGAGRRWFEEYCDTLDTGSVFRERRSGVGHACPCCAHLTLTMRGGFEICPVCFWEDDGQDDHDADKVRGGPNGDLSLHAARTNYARYGACDEGSVQFVRGPQAHELPSKAE